MSLIGNYFQHDNNNIKYGQEISYEFTKMQNEKQKTNCKILFYSFF